MPDGRGAASGTGFTNTGLARAPDGTWWLANQGQADASDGSYTPSLVHLSSDLKTKLGEIPLSGGVRSLQGLAYDTRTDQLLVASLSEHMVRVINLDGSLAGGLSTGETIAPNALAYDPDLNAVIVGGSPGSVNPTTVEWRSLSTGSVIKSLNLAVNPDHGYLDPDQGVQGTFYYTYGDSGRAGKVVVVDVASGQELGRYELPQADAIEGIYVDGGTLWVNNDAYYHQGADPRNAVLKFSITPPAVVVDHSEASTADNIDLNVHDQTSGGSRLVGVPRLFFEGGSASDTVSGGAYADILVGGGGEDLLGGRGGDDRLVGLGGADTLTGGAGKDRLEGGDGSDVAVFSGRRADYAATKVDGGVQLADSRPGSPDGTDLVTGVETFRFSDGSISYSALFGQSSPDPAPPPPLPPPPPPPSGGGGAGSPTLNLSGLSVAENSAAGTVVGTLSATNPGGSNSFSYSLLNDGGGRFAISGGKLVVANGAVLDHEAEDLRTVVVRMSAGGATLLDKTFNIAVLDVDEAPTKIALANVGALAWGAAGRTRVADIVVSDPDTAAAFRDFQLKVEDSRFEIAGGVLYLKAGQTAPAEPGPIGVRIRLNDGDFTLAKTFTLPVSGAPASGGEAGGGGNGGGGGGGVPEPVEPPPTFGGRPTHRADVLQGGSGADEIDGGAGNDLISGGGGADKLTGGSGLDTLNGGDGDDRIIVKRGTGHDVIDGGAGVDRLIADFEKLKAPVILDMGDPSKTQKLSDGTTVVRIEVLEVTGSRQADRITGGAYGDSLTGLNGADLLIGGGGDDRLEGGAGEDTLTGGVGKDRFAYDERGWGTDTITDFQHGVDVLDFRGLGLSASRLNISHSGTTTTLTVADYGSIVLQNDTQAFSSGDFLF